MHWTAVILLAECKCQVSVEDDCSLTDKKKNQNFLFSWMLSGQLKLQVAAEELV